MKCSIDPASHPNPRGSIPRGLKRMSLSIFFVAFVFFTQPASRAGAQPCCLGDADGDGQLSESDVAPFVASILIPPQPGTDAFCRTDVNEDMEVDGLDIADFVALLIADGECPLRDCGNPCQAPVAYGLAGTGSGGGDLVQDDFPWGGGPMVQVCWHGFYFGGGGLGAADVTVTYYADDNGQPGAVFGGSFSRLGGMLDVTEVFLGAPMGFPEYLYSATHAPVSAASETCYWVEIAMGDTASQFFWSMNSPDGNGLSYKNGQPNDTDLAFCINGEIEGGACVPLPTGACCLGDGTCTVTTQADCCFQAGWYQGDGTDCATACPAFPTPTLDQAFFSPDPADNCPAPFATTVNTTILGTGFAECVSTAVLTQAGQTDIPAFNVFFIDPTFLIADFDMTGAAPGAWQAVVVSPDGQASNASPETVTVTACTRGACCFAGPACGDGLDEPSCTGAGGTFQGVGTTCAEVVCP